MMIRLVSILFVLMSFVILSSACTVTPVNEHYYVLGASRSGVELDSPPTKPIVILQTVELADFLRQPQLVMQVNDHQLQKAYYHYWAEDLAEAISRELLQDLNAASTTFNFESSSGRFIGDHQLELYVRIDRFHPSDRSDVTLAGQYWIVSQHDSKTVTSNHFVFQSSLKADGFTQAVKQLRALVSELSTHIAKAVE
jgi:uncharacterized protein